MGLDGVEVIMAVEKAFGVCFEDWEVGRVSTAGELHELVVSKLGLKESRACLTSLAFYRTRRAMTEALSIPRREIRPGTALAGLFPRRGRRRRWAHLRRAASIPLAPLQCRTWVTFSPLVLGLAAAIGARIWLGLGLGWCFLLFFSGLIFGVTLLPVASRFATQFPSGVATVGDLSRHVLSMNYASVAREAGCWNRDEAWHALRALISDQIGVEPEEIRPESRFGDDLGVA